MQKSRQLIAKSQSQVLSGWVMLPIVLILIIGGPAVFIYSIAAGVNAIGHPIVGTLRAGDIDGDHRDHLRRGAVHAAAQRGARVDPVRRVQGHRSGERVLVGQSVLLQRQSPGPFAVQMAQMEGKLAAAQGGRQAGGRGGSAKPPSRHKISLRARTLNGEKLKVNDKRGNPIEIAAVVVWRVQDTAQAAFDVDDYEKYVETQSESALRHLASCYAYDHGEENEITLRSGVEEVSQALRKELQERLAKAGVMVEEARLTHLAYAPEIAQAMLRRQQAEAVIAARQKIVHGAVSMVDMALKELAEKQVVQLDDERKAAMVSNLMVVLCGESEVHPVVNTGTLYT